MKPPITSITAVTLALTASPVWAQNTDIAKLNGSIQVRAWKLLETPLSTPLPAWGEKIRHFNQEVSDLMGSFQAWIEEAVREKPTGERREFASLFATKKYTIGDTVITTGLWRIGATEGSNPYGLRISIK
jgi:hypothetical protein